MDSAVGRNSSTVHPMAIKIVLLAEVGSVMHQGKTLYFFCCAMMPRGQKVCSNFVVITQRDVAVSPLMIPALMCEINIKSSAGVTCVLSDHQLHLMSA